MGDCIYLEPNIRDSIGFQVSELSRIIERSKKDEKKIKIDLRNVQFIHPTTLLGISSIIQTARKTGVDYSLCSINKEVQSYLETINFPVGIFPQHESNWAEKLDTYKDKNYIPLVNFPSTEDGDSTVIRNAVIAKVNEIIEHKLQLSSNEIGAVKFFINEFIENIVEHAGVSNGRIMTQYFPLKEYFEICVIDEGKTILGSYRDNNQHHILNDKQAIDEALKGNSTKDKEQSFGLHNSRNLIVDGIKGKFHVVSGKGMCANKTTTSFSSTWRGTLLAIQIPKKFAEFDMYSFFNS